MSVCNKTIYHRRGTNGTRDNTSRANPPPCRINKCISFCIAVHGKASLFSGREKYYKETLTNLFSGTAELQGMHINIYYHLFFAHKIKDFVMAKQACKPT